MPVIGPNSHPKGPLARLSWGHELLGHRPSLRPSERPLSPPSELCGSDPKSARQVKTAVSQLVGRFESRSVGDTTPKAEYFEPPGQEKGFPLFFFYSIVLDLSQSSVKVDKSIFNSTAKHHPKKWGEAKGLSILLTINNVRHLLCDFHAEPVRYDVPRVGIAPPTW